MTGEPRTILSWVRSHRNRTYGGFLDANCDKAYVIPCWISLLHVVPNTSYLKLVQYVSFICLILAEAASACVRFKAYFTNGGVPAPKVEGFDFSTSAVKADHIGKAKQTFEMAGTALFIIPVTRYVGLLLLACAVPLAYESVRRKVKTRVIYVQCDKTTLDHKIIKFWMQSKAMGSKLIVGDGPARKSLEKKFPDAHFAGAQYGEALSSYYAGSDVFVFPSKTDTFGLVVIEALSSGLPVAAYPVPGPRDILEPRDYDGADQAGALNDDLQQAALKAATLSKDDARAFAAHFSWAACRDMFLGNLAPIPREWAEAGLPRRREMVIEAKAIRNALPRG